MNEIFVCRDGELKNGDVRIIETNGMSVGLYRHDGKYFAYRNYCAHQGGPACEGVMMPKVVDVIAPDRTWIGQDFNPNEMHIVCPWHGWEYKLENGECAGNPRIRLQRFKVIEREGGVYVAV
jgi:nitrite reductase/ring-hydroxylating ferredoxin subunit